MSSYQFPGGPAVGTQEAARMLAAGLSDRRGFFKRAAGLGLAMPVLGGLGLQAQTAHAQDEHNMEGTPESGYVGSDPQSPSTGDESPVPTEVRPHTVYDPVLGPVEAGSKEIAIVAKDASLYIAKDVPYAAWTFDGMVPGRALRVVEGDEIAFTLAVDPNAI